MWKLSPVHFGQPNIPLYNWEQLGKIDSSLLRTMRHITFGRQQALVVNDCGETFSQFNSQGYPISDTRLTQFEEWPSEIWNHQENYLAQPASGYGTVVEGARLPAMEEGITPMQPAFPHLSESLLYRFFAGVKGIGRVLSNNIMQTLGSAGVVDALLNDPQQLTKVKNIKQKKLARIVEHWESDHWKNIRKSIQATGPDT